MRAAKSGRPRWKWIGDTRRSRREEAGRVCFEWDNEPIVVVISAIRVGSARALSATPISTFPAHCDANSLSIQCWDCTPQPDSDYAPIRTSLSFISLFFPIHQQHTVYNSLDSTTASGNKVLFLFSCISMRLVLVQILLSELVLRCLKMTHLETWPHVLKLHLCNFVLYT